ncbi:MAG: hypothetical protein JWM95_2355 [Gemmatimonadetes bacterium]|nr:hypothetical protein [Gemmatimonadota bacterium]
MRFVLSYSFRMASIGRYSEHSHAVRNRSSEPILWTVISDMPDPSPRAHRAPPAQISRITSHGSDQYVLACTARTDASDTTFHYIKEFEEQLQRLRAEAQWKQEHGVTRTGRWFKGILFGMASVLVFLSAMYGWMFTPNGRAARIGFVEGLEAPHGGDVDNAFKRRPWIVSDMTPQEIDAIRHGVRSVGAGKSK